MIETVLCLKGESSLLDIHGLPPAETCGIKALCFHWEIDDHGLGDVLSDAPPTIYSWRKLSRERFQVIPPYFFLAWRIFMSRVWWWFLCKSAYTSSHNFINCSYLEWCLIGSRLVKVATVQRIYRAGQITNLLSTNSDPNKLPKWHLFNHPFGTHAACMPWKVQYLYTHA